MTEWIKPGRCESAHCVEVAEGLADNILIRMSDLPDVQLIATADEFAAFVQAAKAGEYDHV